MPFLASCDVCGYSDYGVNRENLKREFQDHNNERHDHADVEVTLSIDIVSNREYSDFITRKKIGRWSWVRFRQVNLLNPPSP